MTRRRGLDKAKTAESAGFEVATVDVICILFCINLNVPKLQGRAFEELSKSVIWFTTPMQQRSKSRFICDWLSATAGTPAVGRWSRNHVG